MRAPRCFATLVAVAITSMLASCGNDNGTTPGGSATRSTETFTGTLTAHNGVWHTFMVTQAGTVDVTLTAVSTPVTAPVGLGIGTTPTNGCQVQAWNNAAIAGTVLTAPINPGTFCVMVYDAGNVTDSGATYTVTVVHP